MTLIRINGSCSWTWVFSLATSNFILNTVLAVLRAKCFCHLMFRKLECIGRAGECGSDVELGAGTVDTTGLIRRVSLDVGTSNTDQLLVFGFPPLFCTPSAP